GDDGIRLSPVYDVVCTMVYPVIDQLFALSFGGAFNLEGITANNVRKCARALLISTRRLEELIDEIATQLVAHVDEVCHTIKSDYGNAEVLSSIREIVVGRSNALREKICV